MKNCFTTPSGNIKAISLPRADPMIAPRKRNKIRTPRDLFRIGLYHLNCALFLSFVKNINKNYEKHK